MKRRKLKQDLIIRKFSQMLPSQNHYSEKSTMSHSFLPKRVKPLFPSTKREEKTNLQVFELLNKVV